MTKIQIIDGPFAKVYAGGNAVFEYLREGDDLQERADAICDRFWLAAGHSAEIKERNLPLFGVALAGDDRPFEVFTSRAAAERYASLCG